MKSGKDVEMMRKAVKQPLNEEEEEEINDDKEEESLNEDIINTTDSHSHERQILTKLLSELDSLEESGNETEQETRVGSDKPPSNEEIMKALKDLKRQNTITQSLLTVMIVLTLTWQLSEVSLILKIRDGLSNPFKAVAGMIRGFFNKPPREVNVQDVINNVCAGNKQKENVVQPTSLPGLKIPQLPSLEFPGFDHSDEEG